MDRRGYLVPGTLILLNSAAFTSSMMLSVTGRLFQLSSLGKESREFPRFHPGSMLATKEAADTLAKEPGHDDSAWQAPHSSAATEKKGLTVTISNALDLCWKKQAGLNMRFEWLCSGGGRVVIYPLASGYTTPSTSYPSKRKRPTAVPTQYLSLR
jgi:hypothetical protein